MATGRGWRPWQLTRGPCPRPPVGAVGLRRGSGSRPTKDLLPPGARRRECCWRAVSLDNMPTEILLKILSYLDAVNLLSIGCVNRRFYQLASDNLIWVRIYSTAFSAKPSHWKVNSAKETVACEIPLGPEDREAGHWKKKYIAKQVASMKATVAQLLQPANPYTGLPVKIKEALRVSGLGWVIILRDKSGKEYITERADLAVNDTSITITWYCRNWPPLTTLSTLDLCGVTPVFMDQNKLPSRNGTMNRPRWRSLIAQYSLGDLREAVAMGCDGLVHVFCLSPGLLVGLWKREDELAFVMANLHLHQLMERSSLGSASVPYEMPPHKPFLDDGPGSGLHGFQLHVDLHSGGLSYLCGTFRNLFSNKGDIENGYMKLLVINLYNNTQHVPLIGKVGLCWRTDIFTGCIQSCSVMDMTLLDDSGKPFWCFSSPVCMRPSTSTCDASIFLGPRFCMDYEDVGGRAHMDVVWIEETGEYFIISLTLYLSITKVNDWFGTQY